jgi:hypothetical protein
MSQTLASLETRRTELLRSIGGLNASRLHRGCRVALW